MRSNTVQSTTARTHEGAPSPTLSATAELRRTVMANMLFEDGFYESGVDAAQRIRDLIKKVSFEDAAQIAIDAREKMKLRHVPLLIVRELLRNHHGHKVGDLIFRVIQRPDEMGELLALYRKDGGKSEPAQLKIGLARAFKKFDAYQLGKYNRDGAFKLRDVMFLAHPRPNNEGQKAIFDQIAAETLPTPDTWEVALSAGADKKLVFTRLLAENKLGALALLRNLRNMIQAGVDEDVIRGALARMKVERVLPFRFISAAKYAPRLEDALEAAMLRCAAALEPLPGKTALLVDHSLSMNAAISSKSEITRFDSAAAVAMIAREVAERCRVFTFSDNLVEIAPRRGFAMLAALNAVRTPSGTMLGAAVRKVYQQFPECDRIIVITDEQSHDRPPHPQGRGYIINVANNQQGIGYGPWITIDGWSENVLSYLKEYEAE